MLSAFVPIFFTIFIVLDPLGLVPIFIGLSSGMDRAEKDKTIRKSVFTAFFVLTLFIVAGKFILGLLGISPGSFFIAGGIMLFLVSLDMLFGKAKRSKTSDQEKSDGTDASAGDEPSSIAVFPLAIPILAGPGTITTILLFTSSDADPVSTMLMLGLAVVITLAVAMATMKASDLVLRVLGRTGVSVVERIMGLLLAGLSVQFVYDGIVKLGLIPGGLS